MQPNVAEIYLSNTMPRRYRLLHIYAMVDPFMSGDMNTHDRVTSAGGRTHVGSKDTRWDDCARRGTLRAQQCHVRL